MARTQATSRGFATGRAFRVDPQTGGGGGTPPPDPAPVILSGPTLVSRTASSITLTWTVDQFCSSRIEYGLTTSYGTEGPSEPSFDYSTHQETISGLSADTTYHFRVRVTNQSGQETIGSDAAFSTLASSSGGGSTAVYGFGSTVTGGAGGIVRVVSNLNNSGTGSLRDACGLGGFITFSVSGTIHLTSQVNVASNTTIAGETAPGTGITITGWPIQVNGSSRSNIIVRNIRHRGWNGIGSRPSVGTGAECFGGINGAHHLVFQNLSMAYHLDECIGFWRGSHDVTVQDCIIGEGHSDASGHNYAFLIGNDASGISNYGSTTNFSVFRNLIYRSQYRNPNVGYDDSGGQTSPDVQAEIANNLIWPGSISNSYGIQVYWGGKANARYNYIGDTSNAAVQGAATNAQGNVYSVGNVSRNGRSVTGNVGSLYTVPSHAVLTVQSPASTAASYVLANAGCRVGGLDAYDTAAIAAINTAGL